MSDSDKVYDTINLSYTQPARHYHNLDHLHNCLRELDEVRELAQDADAIEIALWYHDIVYDIAAPDNEARSAQLVFEICMAAGLPGSFAGVVSRLIIATDHRGEVKTKQEQLIRDIDLSILGKPSDEYHNYETSIRKEYSMVPDDEFKTGRMNFLRQLLDQRAIYLTDFFSGKYELTARANIKHALVMLSR